MENQILLEKIGETRSDKLINDCNKIYMENFRKQFPNYFESNYLKSICKIITTPKDSNEILAIGMSCMNDLMTKQFSQWLGGYLGGFAQTSGDIMKNTGGNPFATGNHHGGGNNLMWGMNSAGSRGLNMDVTNSTDIPFKDMFAPQASTLGQNLIVNSGTFSAGLNTVTWSGGNTSLLDFTISYAHITASLSRAGGGSALWLFLADSISPSVAVLLGESIFLEYTFAFS